MRSQTISYLAALACVVACGDAQIRNCDLNGGFQDNNHGITVLAVLPSDCPVPLGTRGEEKFMGATVLDGAPRDYDNTTIVVWNSLNNQVGSDLDLFVKQGDLGPWASYPKATFPGGTGYNGAITPGQDLPWQANDHGRFRGQLTGGSGQIGMEGNMTVTYRGANVNAAIVGPDVPLPGSEGSWSGYVSGGSAPYSYAWYRNGELVSTSSSYSANVGSEEFGLRLVATDQVTSSRWTDYWVQVGGMRATMSGPSIIYYSEGNATWTVDYRGGYSPHTVEWYLVDSDGQEYYQGSGTSLTTYPPHAGSWTVYAKITDSQGKAITSALYISAIGDGNGGCVPVPPQITCDP